MADDTDIHDELDALALDVERAIREFDSALERHEGVRRRAPTPTFRSESVEFDETQQLFF